MRRKLFLNAIAVIILLGLATAAWAEPRSGQLITDSGDKVKVACFSNIGSFYEVIWNGVRTKIDVNQIKRARSLGNTRVRVTLRNNKRFDCDVSTTNGVIGLQGLLRGSAAQGTADFLNFSFHNPVTGEIALGELPYQHLLEVSFD